MLTNQEIFERAIDHLLAQKQKSVQGKEEQPAEMICRYRTSEGLKCAVGCLISDELYDAHIEGTVPGLISEAERQKNKWRYATEVRKILLADVLFKAGIDTSNSRTVVLLQHLQRAHDHRINWMLEGEELQENIKVWAQQIANQHKLQLPERFH